MSNVEYNRKAENVKPANDNCPLELAQEPRILDRMAGDLERAGLVGEKRAAKLVYLLLTSRFLDQPICAVVKGQSSAGKSHVLKTVKALFPKSAYHSVTSISPKALAYNTELDLEHRILVIEEAAGFKKGDDAAHLRCLVSEHYIHHETVVDGKALTLYKDGPTGLLITTTERELEPELETRMFSIPINDSAEQTAAIMLSLAKQSDGSIQTGELDVAAWHDLQKRLEGAGHRVVIPYAQQLAKLVPPSLAVRLRRDFGAVLRMVETHALLHQERRRKTHKDGSSPHRTITPLCMILSRVL